MVSSIVSMDSHTRRFNMASHTADIAVDIFGGDIAELLVNAAHALNAIIFTEAVIRPEVERTVNLQSVDDDTLLVDWLNELIYIIDAEQTLFSEFSVLKHRQGSADILCRGESIDSAKHKQTREVKAATYYGAHIEEGARGYTARIVFDV